MNWQNDEAEYDSVYDSADEKGVVKLYRREAEAEKMRLRVIDNLLGSLTWDDAQLNLFSFQERVQWGLRRNARRS